MCHFLAELSVIIFFFTATSSLINSSKLNPNSSLIAVRLAISGIPLLVSHFVIACLDTFSLSASCSCEKPACFLHSLIFSPKFIFESSLLFGKLIITIFEFLTRNRHLQCLLQYVADIVYNYFTKKQMRFLLCHYDFSFGIQKRCNSRSISRFPTKIVNPSLLIYKDLANSFILKLTSVSKCNFKSFFFLCHVYFSFFQALNSKFVYFYYTIMIVSFATRIYIIQCSSIGFFIFA